MFIFFNLKKTCDICFFFFFQAEDGIRDLTVTGVQTCALPIWGDLLTLICAVCFGGQIVAVTELARRYDPRRLVFIQIAATAVVAALATALFERPQIHWTPRFTGALLYTILFASTVCFLLQMRAQREMSSARAALIFCFEPLFAALTSW